MHSLWQSFFLKKNSDLTKHLETHSGEKLYQCSHCDKTFHRILILQYISKHLFEEIQYQCIYFDMTFIQKDRGVPWGGIWGTCPPQLFDRGGHSIKLSPPTFWKHTDAAICILYVERARYCHLYFFTTNRRLK